MKKERSLASKIIIRVLISFFIALLLTALSIFVPIKIDSYRGFELMQFGKPFPFFNQTYSGTVRNELFPLRVFPQFSMLETTTFDFWMCFLSFVVIFAVVLIIVFWFSMFRKKFRGSKIKKN